MQNPSPLLLLTYEDPKDILFEGGAPPYAAYSHFTHQFVLAHAALRLGWQVYFFCTRLSHATEILQIYPDTITGKTVEFMSPDFQPDIICAVNMPKTVAVTRPIKPNAIGVLILNAHSWLESDFPIIDYPEWLRVALARDIDFVLTQNDRMADIGHKLFHMLGRWKWRDRFLIAPNTFTEERVRSDSKRYTREETREEMLVRDDEIVIINSGGPWSWTDTECFATAFAEVIREGAKRLKFIQMGIIQDDNHVERHIIPFWQQYYVKNEDLIRQRRLHIFTDWREASNHLPGWNYGADLGLNVSRDTVENYQSHRVRFMDYARAGLPTINTTGNHYTTYAAKDAVLRVEPGDLAGYKSLLWQLERGEINLGQLRQNMIHFRDTQVSEKLLAGPLQEILRLGRIPLEERLEGAQILAALYTDVSEHHFARNFVFN